MNPYPGMSVTSLLRASLLGCALVVPLRGIAAGLADNAREQILRMTDFFDTTLPGTLGPRNMALHFTPKFADVRDREFVRFPFEIRYGATERIDLTGGLSPFAPNPLNSGQDHRWGPGEAKLGIRYDLGERWKFFDDTTVGLETRLPIGKPPLELNDHYAHVRPFVSAAHKVRRWPDTTFYANLAYDRSVALSSREEPPREIVRRHIVEVVPGLLFKPGQFGAFGEYRLRHVTEEFDRYLTHEGRVGAIWDVPLARSEQWRLPGKWQLELAYKHVFSRGSDRDLDSGVAARVTWRTTLREVLSNASWRPPETAR